MALDLIVPVDQMIPVNLNVKVDIPLNQTDLHKPFVGLQEVVRPYYQHAGRTARQLGRGDCAATQPAALCQWIFAPMTGN